MEERFIDSPKLSVIVVARNDDHGGNFMKRLRMFVNGIAAHSDAYRLPTETIIVEWNPDLTRPGLAESLRRGQRSSFNTLRVITVDPAIHERYTYSQKMALFQFIGKNAGIRRARGTYILATNADVLLSDELFSFIARGDLTPGKLYRALRHDVGREIPEPEPLQKQLEFCRDHILRTYGKFLVHNFQSGVVFRTYPDDIDEVYRRYRIPKPIYNNVCGDFQLMARENWHQLRGYPEWDLHSMNVDHLLEIAAVYSGIEEVILDDAACLYHVDHDGGWIPDTLGTADSEEMKQKRRGMPFLSYGQYLVLADRMERQGKGVVFNGESWGLAGRALQEGRVFQADWDRDGSLTFGEPAPAAPGDLAGAPRPASTPDDVSNVREWLDNINGPWKREMMTFGAQGFHDWVMAVAFQERQPVEGQEDLRQVLAAKLERLSKGGKLVVFGTGTGYQRYLKPVLRHYGQRLACFVDNDLGKAGMRIDGIPVCLPAGLDAAERENTLILVASSYYEDIKKQLASMGFAEHSDFVRGLTWLTHYFVFEDYNLNFDEL
ncbi:hypothetical protein GJ688_11850 [Heliobacillus mobilis]|uniref:Glycosyltransferase n=1 Tax=Heliobacterium mobile TaxID=28064 RepID=A0A6I3SL21_HELMO|nr:hypothetical protein [Heliobacterium mobile]MTV49668.1 hypothetical protein [Heliobacterium mobile]